MRATGAGDGTTMKLRLWPRSLAARTAVVLLVGLAIVQMAGLTIHALDRLDVQRLGQARDLAVRVVGVYRTMALTDHSLTHIEVLKAFLGIHVTTKADHAHDTVTVQIGSDGRPTSSVTKPSKTS